MVHHLGSKVWSQNPDGTCRWKLGDRSYFDRETVYQRWGMPRPGFRRG